MIKQKTLIRLNGGPMDGYHDQIEMHADADVCIPFPHHRKACGCKTIPRYKRVGRSDVFAFAGYLPGSNTLDGEAL